MSDLPTLILLFNRPTLTAACIRAIRTEQPGRIYLAADGPRANSADDRARCDEARRVAMQSIDWPCEIRTRFLKTNAGCERAVSSAIDWFFQHESKGIVLEDDCWSGPDFFSFASEMLDRYREDPRVGLITANNFQQGRRRGSEDYYFSKYNHCWGWATWKDRWQQFDFNMQSGQSDRTIIRGLSHHPDELDYWSQIFRSVRRGKINSWAYRWLYSCWKNLYLTVTPQQNLVLNVGTGTDATHTQQQAPLTEPVRPWRRNQRCPAGVMQHAAADAFVATHHFRCDRTLRARLNRLLPSRARRRSIIPGTAAQLMDNKADPSA